MTTTLDQIRSDLKTLRLYYSNQEQCDNLFRFIPHKVTELVQTYSEMIKTAPLDLYLLYCELYVNGSTQEVAAEQFDFSTEYVRRRNKVLLEYLQSKLEEKRRAAV